MPDLLASVRDRLVRFVKEVLLSGDALRENIRYIIFGTLGIAFLVVILLLIFYRPAHRLSEAAAPVSASGTTDAGARTGNAGAMSTQSLGGRSEPGPVPPAVAFRQQPAPEDYLVPPADDPLADGWALSRRPHEQWSQAEIDEFWIDPAKIGVENLSDQNDGTVRRLLSQVP